MLCQSQHLSLWVSATFPTSTVTIWRREGSFSCLSFSVRLFSCYVQYMPGVCAPHNRPSGILFWSPLCLKLMGYLSWRLSVIFGMREVLCVCFIFNTTPFCFSSLIPPLSFQCFWFYAVGKLFLVQTEMHFFLLALWAQQPHNSILLHSASHTNR